MNKIVVSILIVLGIPLSLIGAVVIVSLFNHNSNTLKRVEIVPVNTPTSQISPISPREKHIRTIKPLPSQVIFLMGSITEGSSQIANKIQLASQTEKELFIVIDSMGGSIFTGAKIISAIEGSNIPVNTVCIGMCASMAAIIHQYGSKRMMSDRSYLMFHDASGAENGSISQMTTRLLFVQRFMSKMNAYIAKRVGIPFNEFTSSFDHEFWIDAEDSTDRNFNDEIVNLVLEKPELPSLLEIQQNKERQLNVH